MENQRISAFRILAGAQHSDFQHNNATMNTDHAVNEVRTTLDISWLVESQGIAKSVLGGVGGCECRASSLAASPIFGHPDHRHVPTMHSVEARKLEDQSPHALKAKYKASQH